MDVVWDRYISNSLKLATREKRGKGVRRKVAGITKIPKKWQDFLHDEANKQELFDFLAQQIQSFDFVDGKKVFLLVAPTSSARGQIIACYLPSDHEEADTRIVLHLVDS